MFTRGYLGGQNHPILDWLQGLDVWRCDWTNPTRLAATTYTSICTANLNTITIYILLYYIIYSTYHMSFFQHSQNNPEAYFILIQVVVQWSVCHPMVHSKVSETQRIQHDFPPWWFIPLSKLSENPSYQWIDPTCPTKAGISTASENHNPSESIIPRNSVSITIGPTVLISKHQPLETSQVLKLPIPSRGDASIFQVIRSWGSPRALRN